MDDERITVFLHSELVSLKNKLDLIKQHSDSGTLDDFFEMDQKIKMAYFLCLPTIIKLTSPDKQDTISSNQQIQ